MNDDRIASGDPRLDVVLGGGLLANSIAVIMGQPGSGKTTLAEQYLFGNATPQRPGVYLSTVSEPLEKLLRYGQRLSFFEPAAVGSSIFFDDLGTVLHEGGLAGVDERIGALLRQHRPGILVIDSFKALAPYAADHGEYRDFLYRLAATLSAFPVTTLWVGEYPASTILDEPEFAVADAIVSLAVERLGHRHKRLLDVVKLRGSDFISGRHAYRITGDGIRVFPRLADSAGIPPTPPATERISSGVDMLDTMLHEGYWSGASTMVAGPSGTGKTLLGLHFVFAGADRGEHGIVATFQEDAAMLTRVCEGFGWKLDRPEVTVLHRSLVDLLVDEWVYELLETAERTGARRILIDSLGDLAIATGDEIRFREFIYSLLTRTAQAGISVVMTQETEDLYSITRLAQHGISHVSDNVVVLQYLRGDSEIKRAVTVLKSRASIHDPAIVQFTITDDGFALGTAFSADQDLQ